MKPFLVTTSRFSSEGLPVFTVDNLDKEQQAFVNGCLKSWTDALANGHIKEAANFASVMYRNSNDFAGSMMTAEDPL